MPKHFRFTARGVFIGTDEQWSFGFHFTQEQSGQVDAEYSDVNQGAVTTAFDTFFSANGPYISNKTQMTDWRCYIIGTNNRMVGNPILVDVSEVPVQGGTQLAYPPQIALVATLVADNRGPAKLGRFYIPGPSAPMDASMRISETVASDCAEAVTQLLKGVSDAIDMPGGTQSAKAVNVSSRGGVAGTLQEVDHVEVGRVLDTVRSRRSALLEERHVHGQIDW